MESIKAQKAAQWLHVVHKNGRYSPITEEVQNVLLQVCDLKIFDVHRAKNKAQEAVRVLMVNDLIDFSEFDDISDFQAAEFMCQCFSFEPQMPLNEMAFKALVYHYFGIAKYLRQCVV